MPSEDTGQICNTGVRELLEMERDVVPGAVKRSTLSVERLHCPQETRITTREQCISRLSACRTLLKPIARDDSRHEARR